MHAGAYHPGAACVSIRLMPLWCIISGSVKAQVHELIVDAASEDIEPVRAPARNRRRANQPYAITFP